MVATASGGSCAAIVSSVQRDTSRPRAAPSRQHERLDQQLPISCERLAPIDSRTAISPARPAPRTSSRLAMFAQAISSTTPVTPKSRMSGVVASAGIELCPLEPGASVIFFAWKPRHRLLAHALLQRGFDVVDDGGIRHVDASRRLLDRYARLEPREQIAQ